MAERTNALSWKGSEPDEGSGGSNPPGSALELTSPSSFVGAGWVR